MTRPLRSTTNGASGTARPLCRPWTCRARGPRKRLSRTSSTIPHRRASSRSKSASCSICALCDSCNPCSCALTLVGHPPSLLSDPRQACAELSRAERTRSALARLRDLSGSRVQHRLARRVPHRNPRPLAHVHRPQRPGRRRRAGAQTARGPGESLRLLYPFLARSVRCGDGGVACEMGCSF